ncbi:MAG: hypothetical protein AAFP84_09040 [Actinomycetota bacterium]
MNTTLSRNVSGAAMVAALIGLGVAGCGSDDSVTDEVSQAANQVEQAAESGNAQDIDNAEEAVEKADDAINERLKKITAGFDGAEAKIADDAKDAYVGYRKQLADVETSVVAAIAATPDEQNDAWNDAASKAKDLETRIADADTKLDGELRDAVTKLGKDLSELVQEIEKGLS